MQSRSRTLLPLTLAVLAALPAEAGIRCGTHALRDVLPRIDAASWLRPRAAHASREPGLPPAAYQVGESREFWAWDLSVMPPGFRRVTATCKAVTDGSYVFVEDDLVARGKVTDADVARIDTALHERTPIFSVAPGKGILELEQDHLGTPPDALDGDPRVYFLVLRLDEFNGMGFDGFFNAFDQMTEEEAWGQYQQHSNEAEVLYLNGERGDISSSYMRGVLAHELAHLIAHNYDGEELPWLSETLGEAAMQLCGYYTDKAHVARQARKPERPLVSGSYANYGAGFLFSAYLRGLEGPEVWGELLRDPGKGRASVEGVLASLGREVGFDELFAAWGAANLFRGLGRDVPAYRHPGLVVPGFTEKASLPAEGGEVAGELAPWGVQYVRLAPGGYQVATTGPVEAYELLTGQPPRRIDPAGERLDTLDETRWVMLVGLEAEDEDRDWSLGVTP